VFGPSQECRNRDQQVSSVHRQTAHVGRDFESTSDGWDPARARKKFKLGLSEEEIRTIRAKFPKTATDGKGGLFADGVFEGGGVLGLAFLGAARCCAEVGIRWKGLAGTSAGAITASLLAAVEKNDDLERLFAGLDFLHWPLLPRHSLLATRHQPTRQNRVRSPALFRLGSS